MCLVFLDSGYKKSQRIMWNCCSRNPDRSRSLDHEWTKTKEYVTGGRTRTIFCFNFFNAKMVY